MSPPFDRVALTWLPPAPPDFRSRCKALGPSPWLGAQVRELASFALDASGLNSLAKAIDRLRNAGAALDGLQPFVLGMAGDGSHELIRDAVIASAARHGVLLDVVLAPFNAVESALLDAESPFVRRRPQAVLLNFTHRAFRIPDASFDDSDTGAALVSEALGRLQALLDAVERAGGAMMLQTVPQSPITLFGSLDRSLPATAASVIDRLNQGMVRLLKSPHVLFDAAALADTVGLDAWHDPAQWHGFKLPFSQRLVPLYADHVARTVAAMRGLSRKCLVLDLDNTIWGGVVGDDGVHGIRIGQGLADGEAFLEVQRLAKQLRHRGVVLAVSSKNDDAVARRVFREHPDMLLAESEITVFQANWQDKASNLQAIARELDLGLDALVLLDDNPAERDLVRRLLPAVAVPELPDDPAWYAVALTAAGYFETVSYSAEDARRADMYAARAEAVELREAAGDLEEFLRSLDMEITLAPFDAIGRQRIAQLINKSNQFNLTTRRYTEAEVQALERDPAVRTWQVRLKDRLADHGMICVVISRARTAVEWEVDTWLMSCRVLGRRVEEAVLGEIVALARREGVRRLVGRYIPSGRNSMVQDHFQRLGFTPAGAEGDTTIWTLAIDEFEPRVLPFSRLVTAQ